MVTIRPSRRPAGLAPPVGGADRDPRATAGCPPARESRILWPHSHRPPIELAGGHCRHTRGRLIIVSDTDVRQSPWRAVAAATALNTPLGSLYAFSVFLTPLETLLGLSRADLALVFALATAGFGAGMNLAPHVYGLASTPILGLAQLALGYGVLFGVGGGAGYILVQQAVNLAVTRRHGLMNGYLVGLYPAGAMIAAPLFGWSVREFGVRATLGGLATVLAVTGVISARLIARSGITLAAATAAVEPDAQERRRPLFWRLWLVFFLAASAGLMVLSQAAGIIASYGGAAT